MLHVSVDTQIASVVYFLGFVFLGPIDERDKNIVKLSVSDDVIKPPSDHQSLVTGRAASYYSMLCAHEPLYKGPTGEIVKWENRETAARG